jgi:hypothetical protein
MTLFPTLGFPTSTAVWGPELVKVSAKGCPPLNLALSSRTARFTGFSAGQNTDLKNKLVNPNFSSAITDLADRGNGRFHITANNRFELERR